MTDRQRGWERARDVDSSLYDEVVIRLNPQGRLDVLYCACRIHDKLAHAVGLHNVNPLFGGIVYRAITNAVVADR